ncbi:glutamate racemase [Balneola vulgaris]|uniref:glutamate racemase n=1 Tax=Balneola vulgaris TaxID=287535 RepID=UPI00036BB747|nr:glutamate racemase [Balneola vulgaris]
MNSPNKAPIGIFDSGIGGLTVAKAVAEALPNEHIIYFGDTARVPYGIKSTETVRDYALQITDFLIQKGVKMILIACNTVSAFAKDEIIQLAKGIPVLDVISAGTETAFSHPKHQHIGVIGTLGTVNSEAYIRAIKEHNASTVVSQKACPLLVPLAEEGWINNDIAKLTLTEYLEPFKSLNIDSLILGCTHYPLFKEVIPSILANDNIEIIDSAESIANTAKMKLEAMRALNDSSGKFECYVTDRPQRFHELAERFLGRKISNVIVTHL